MRHVRLLLLRQPAEPLKRFSQELVTFPSGLRLPALILGPTSRRVAAETE
jgi:hypothetical protein